MLGLDTRHTVPQHVLCANGLCTCCSASPRLSVLTNGQPTKTRTYHIVSRVGMPSSLGVYNNNVKSVERALLERYFLCDVNGTFQPPLPVHRKDFATVQLRKFRDQFVQCMKPLATRITPLEVVSRYTGAKRRLYMNALVRLSRDGINADFATLRMFTKFEKQALDKACRGINPRSTEYNIELGRFLKDFEKPAYKIINKLWCSISEHTVIKGLNVVQSARQLRMKWDRFHNPVAVGLDAKKFDMHVSRVALEYEHSFYNLVFRHPRLRWLLLKQLFNKGIAYCDDGVVRFRMVGTRCSGDLNTSLGNCILMCAMIWALCQELDIIAELANNGDDCVVIMEACDLDQFMRAVVEWFAVRGFRMEVEDPVYKFERIVFCQSQPVFDGRQWRMVRDVRTCLKKDPICLVPLPNAVAFEKWLWAVGTCGMSLVPGIPILGEFYRLFKRCGKVTSRRHIEHIFRNTSMLERVDGLDEEWWEPTPESRMSFYEAFGITPDYQIAIEQYHRNCHIAANFTVEHRSGVGELGEPPFLRHL